MRGVVVAVLAFLLGACAGGGQSTSGASPTGDWKIARGADRIADQTEGTALLVTRSANGRIARERPGWPQLASLQLMCFDNGPVVRLHFNYHVGANNSATVAYRFDENPGRDAKARFLRDRQTMVIENKDDVARFADELRTSKTLFVRVNSLLVGQSTAEFQVAGAPAAIDQAYMACPLSPVSKPRTSGLGIGIDAAA